MARGESFSFEIAREALDAKLFCVRRESCLLHCGDGMTCIDYIFSSEPPPLSLLVIVG